MKYMTAHPNSPIGNMEFAHARGWDFIAFLPNHRDGLYVYRRTSLPVRIYRAALARCGGAK